MVSLNDQMLSIRHYLYTIYSDRIVNLVAPDKNKMRLETEGRVRTLTRPLWRIVRSNHRTVDYGVGGFREDCQWQLSYFSTGRQDVDEVTTQLRNALESGGSNGKIFHRIPAWRFNWIYPQPIVQARVFSGPGLPAGQYTVRVSGIDICDNESVASDTVLVTLDQGNNALWVQIPRQPPGGMLFKSFNVYVNGTLQTTITKPTSLVPLYPTTQVTELSTGGRAPLEVDAVNPVRVRWKFLRVNSYTTSVREDEIENGVFNGYVTMETSVFHERDRQQNQAVDQITGSYSLLPAPVVVPEVPYLPSPAPPVFPIAVTSENQVVVGDP